jgi:phosphate transport system substrate-binding protein
MGSTSVLPIAQKIAEAYMTKDNDVKISVTAIGSRDGLKALRKGKADIASSSRFLKDKEIEEFVEKKIYPVPFAIAYDCVVPIVHPSNPAGNLTLQQLKDIYRGRIYNWKRVGGPDKTIVVISRNDSSGTHDVWETIVMNEEKITRFASFKDSNMEVVQAVSSNKYAIGYVAIGYVDNSVKGLTVNGVKASAEAALNGSFPIHRALYMFTNGWPSGDILNFINFVLDPERGQKYVKEAGFIPLY